MHIRIEISLVLFSFTHSRLYGAKTVKTILANLWYYKLKSTPVSITTSPAGTKRCMTPVIETHLVLGHTGLNGGCNSEASTGKGNPSANKGQEFIYSSSVKSSKPAFPGVPDFIVDT
jgi:hypothetical protein